MNTDNIDYHLIRKCSEYLCRDTRNTKTLAETIRRRLEGEDAGDHYHHILSLTPSIDCLRFLQPFVSRFTTDYFKNLVVLFGEARRLKVDQPTDNKYKEHDIPGSYVSRFAPGMVRIQGGEQTGWNIVQADGTLVRSDVNPNTYFTDSCGPWRLFVRGVPDNEPNARYSRILTVFNSETGFIEEHRTTLNVSTSEFVTFGLQENGNPYAFNCKHLEFHDTLADKYYTFPKAKKCFDEMSSHSQVYMGFGDKYVVIGYHGMIGIFSKASQELIRLTALRAIGASPPAMRISNIGVLSYEWNAYWSRSLVRLDLNDQNKDALILLQLAFKAIPRDLWWNIYRYFLIS